MSNGRLELGVGRGVSPYELQAFGVDSQNTRAIFDEAMEILVQGLSQPRLNFQGQYYQYDNVPMELEPLQKPYPPMWYPTHNPESMPYVAGNGFNFVSQGPASVVAQNADAYRKIWQQHVDDPNRLNGHVAEPKIGIFRQILVADTDGAAEAAAKSAHQDWFHSITKLWHAHDNHFPDGLFNWDVSTQAQTIIFGSPSRVKEQIGSLLEASHCNYVIFIFAWGTMTYEESQRSMQLFTEEVMPEFVGKPVSTV
jgi:alkanesulfonate monooxygenase SsuD/methylene tetrahydromethanopterin reductase-like flavin-dependent oxidoreductase (luciferase family)